MQSDCILGWGGYARIHMKEVILFLALLLAQFSPGHAAEKIRVSSFSTILTEIAGQVGGDRVAITAHVKPGVDPHDFEPKPGDLQTVSRAQLVLLSAKHMEGYVAKLKQTAAAGRVVEVGAGFSSLRIKDDHGHGETVEDPHWWHSISCVEKAVKIVRDELTRLSPNDKALFDENAAKYLGRLDALERWAKSEIAKLPRNKRKLVTSHDAFQYFAKDHGFTIHAIEGVSSADQPSSKKVAEIIALIKAQGVKAIFSETIENPKVLREITRETGAVIGGELHADGLGAGEAATYEGMYRHNVSTIVNALK